MSPEVEAIEGETNQMPFELDRLRSRVAELEATKLVGNQGLVTRTFGPQITVWDPKGI